MFPIERYLGVLKIYVRNKARPKGCRAEGYLVDEARGLCTEYMRDFGHTRCKIWNEEVERRMTGVVCEGKGLKQRLSQ